MGTYDLIKIPCPECSQEEHFQSKSGDCIMRTYTLENCPADVMLDINRHSPYKCTTCGTLFFVKFNVGHPAPKTLSISEVEVVKDTSIPLNNFKSTGSNYILDIESLKKRHNLDNFSNVHAFVDLGKKTSYIDGKFTSEELKRIIYAMNDLNGDVYV